LADPALLCELAGLGTGLLQVWKPIGIAAGVGAACLTVLFACIGIVKLG
jgi:hypothetical protein